MLEAPGLVQILAVVERHFGFEAGVVQRGKERTKTRVMARQLAMHFVRERLGWSYPEIGAAFARDHTTVLWACRRSARMLAWNSPAWKRAHAEIERALDTTSAPAPELA